MKFIFTGRHMEIGQSLTTKAEELYKSLEIKYNIEFIEVNVVMRKENHLFYTDIAIKTSNKVSFHASGYADSPVASFDIVANKTELQIQKKKRSQVCGCKGPCAEALVERYEYDNSLKEGDKSTDSAQLIIAEILEDLPLVSVSEAANKLNDKCHVFIFENIATNAVNVVYLRKDGNIGWIDYLNKK